MGCCGWGGGGEGEKGWGRPWLIRILRFKSFPLAMVPLFENDFHAKDFRQYSKY